MNKRTASLESDISHRVSVLFPHEISIERWFGLIHSGSTGVRLIICGSVVVRKQADVPGAKEKAGNLQDVRNGLSVIRLSLGCSSLPLLNGFSFSSPACLMEESNYDCTTRFLISTCTQDL